MEFAKIENNIVINVEVSSQEHIDTLEGNYVATPSNGTYAGIGFSYDEKNKVFIAPQPFESWKLNDKFQWIAPKELPSDGKKYYWDEQNLNWISITN